MSQNNRELASLRQRQGRTFDLDDEMAQRAVPWTTGDYERVRREAESLVRHIVHTGERMLQIDGHQVWKLLGALDRAEER